MHLFSGAVIGSLVADSVSSSTAISGSLSLAVLDNFSFSVWQVVAAALLGAAGVASLAATARAVRRRLVPIKVRKS
jgi:hypothetical protein